MMLKDQAPGAYGNQQHSAHVPHPRDGKKGPGRQVQVVGEHVVVVGAAHLVKQHDGLHSDDKQQHQSGKDIDEAFEACVRQAPDQVHGDVAAPVAGGGNAPEDQDAQHQTTEVVSVRDRGAEEFAQQHRDEDVGGHQSDEHGGHPLDGINDAVKDVFLDHGRGLHAASSHR
jgi:hypothetical protein